MLPAPGSEGGPPAARQPPSVRGRIWITTGGNTYSIDTNMEPTWTWQANGFKNERNLRTDATVQTCDNDVSRCTFVPDVAFYKIEASVPAIMSTDLVTTILPAFSEVNGGPRLTTCGGACNYDVLIKGAPPTDPKLNGAGGRTWVDAYSAGTPAEMLSQTVYYNNAATYSHDCASQGSGCIGPRNDPRPLLAHEIGHTLGLGHCDTDAGMSVMCAARSTTTNELYFEGYHYWTPRPADVQAIGLMY